MKHPCIFLLLCAAAWSQSIPVPTTTTEIYDFRDLVENLEEQPALAYSETFVSTVRDFIEPALAGSEQSVQALGAGVLVVRGSAKQHAWVDGFMRAARFHEQAVLHLSWLVGSLPEEAVEELALDSGVALAPGELARTKAVLKGHDDFRAISSPRLALYSGQSGTITIQSELVYIADYRVYDAVEPVGALVVPEVRTLGEGIEQSGTAVMLDDEVVGLRVESVWSEIARPIPAKETEHGPVARPELLEVRTAFKARLALGHGVLFIHAPDEGRCVVQVVEVSKME